MLGDFDNFFNKELHPLFDKVAAVRDSNRIVVEEEVGCKFVSKGVGDVACNEAADGGRDSKVTKFGGIRGIFVQTK